MKNFFFLGLLAISRISFASVVEFDIQPASPAVLVSPPNIAAQLPESQHVQVKLDISTIVTNGFQGVVDEATIKIHTHRPMVQVADFWPRTEMYSQVTTPVSVYEDHDRLKHAWIQGVGGYPGIGSAQGQAYMHDRLNRDVQFQQAPPMQLLVAAGTLNRRSGVYFKLRSTPQATLEGLRSFLITLEVPTAWRGDILEIQTVAFGRRGPESEQSMKELGESRFWVAVYRDGDTEAANYALAFAQQQNKLRLIAHQYNAKIKKQAYPTPVHRIGHALDMYEPLVATNYLDDWMFGDTSRQPNGLLPVELRVAMLDFIDSRAIMERMSRAQVDLRPTSVARHMPNSRVQ
jgi:hypothetical protein